MMNYCPFLAKNILLEGILLISFGWFEQLLPVSNDSLIQSVGIGTKLFLFREIRADFDIAGVIGPVLRSTQQPRWHCQFKVDFSW